MRLGDRAGVIVGSAGITLLMILASCEREDRRFTEAPPTATAASAVTQSSLQPGPITRLVDVRTAYDNNAYAMSEGQRLFDWYNCSGCHAHGGGGIGPALMDDEWIYGSEPENIVATIVQGRPNGMPSFAGKIPTTQLWQIAAYVRSMSGLNHKLARPSRTDHMEYKAEESKVQPEKPKPAATPPGSVRP